MSRLLTSPDRCVPFRPALWLVLVVIGFLLAGALPANAQNSYPARIDPYINDFAKVITSEDMSNIRQVQSDLKSQKGIELVVVTINSINDYQTGDTTLESFATHLFNTWGIGDAKRNDGVMLLVALKDRTLRVELGAGYGSGHSPEMQAIIDNTIVPEFKQNAYGRGIFRGVKAIANTLTGGAMPQTTGSAPQSSSAAVSMTLAGLVVLIVTVALTVALLVLMGIFPVIIVVIGLSQLRRRIPPTCTACGVRMTCSSREAGTSYLEVRRPVVVDYDVWSCPTCGTSRIKKYLRGVSSSGLSSGSSYRSSSFRSGGSSRGGGASGKW